MQNTYLMKDLYLILSNKNINGPLKVGKRSGTDLTSTGAQTAVSRCQVLTIMPSRNVSDNEPQCGHFLQS